MENPDAGPARSAKYVVAARLGRWCVRRDQEDAGAFADKDEAVRFACRLARDGARGGAVGVVVVQAEVHEMHCFTPAHADLPGPSHRLRVVQGGS